MLSNGFEGLAAGDYAPGSVINGWTGAADPGRIRRFGWPGFTNIFGSTNGIVEVEGTNPVKVVTVPALADTGTNVLALHFGGITRTCCQPWRVRITL